VALFGIRSFAILLFYFLCRFFKLICGFQCAQIDQPTLAPSSPGLNWASITAVGACDHTLDLCSRNFAISPRSSGGHTEVTYVGRSRWRRRMVKYSMVVALCSPPSGIIVGCEREREREREREFYSQLHCRHTRRAMSPSKLVPVLSNTYNEQYTKENIHRQRRNRQYGKNKHMKKKQIVCTYNNKTSKDYKQYTILISMIILLPIILIKNE